MFFYNVLLLCDRFSRGREAVSTRECEGQAKPCHMRVGRRSLATCGSGAKGRRNLARVRRAGEALPHCGAELPAAASASAIATPAGTPAKRRSEASGRLSPGELTPRFMNKGKMAAACASASGGCVLKRNLGQAEPCRTSEALCS